MMSIAMSMKGAQKGRRKDSFGSLQTMVVVECFCVGVSVCVSPCIHETGIFTLPISLWHEDDEHYALQKKC